MSRIIGIFLIALFFGACAGSKTTASKDSNEVQSGLSYEDQSRVLKLIFDGEKAELKGNAAKAISNYRECVEVDPESAVCYYKLATVYFSQGNYQMASSHIQKAIRIDQSNKWYYLIQTQSYLALGEAELGIESFKKVVALEPDNIEYQLELVELYAQQGKFDKAIDLLEEVEKKYGSNPEFNIRKQDFYMASGQPDKAIETCKELIAQYPDQPNYYGLLALLYENVGEDEKEFEAYQTLVELDPENGLAHLKLSYIYQERDERALSEQEMALAFKSVDLEIDIKINVLTQYYEKLIRDTSYWSHVVVLLNNLELANPNDSRTYSVISDFYTQQEKFEIAREYLLTSLELQKDRFQVWNQLILLDGELLDWPAMVDHSDDALELFPSNPALYYYQGIGYVQLGDFESAIEILETGKMMVFKSESGLIDFYVLLGDAYNGIDNFKKSDENYDLALKANPNNAYVLNNYAYYLSIRKEKLKLAETMAQKAVELEPNQYNYQDTYGWVLFQLGKYPEAAKWLKLAVNNGGDVNGEIIEHYADALYMMGNEEEALLMWKKAQEVGDASDRIDEKVSSGTYVD
jgi:tetratricopeptide (TPR) repeat protein